MDACLQPSEPLNKLICHSDHQEETLHVNEWLKVRTSKISRYARNDNLISGSLV